MAKKITEKDINNPGNEDGAPTRQPEKETVATASGNDTPEPSPRQEIPTQADRILRSFPNYAELYIDFQGGIYTVDTPPIFRSNATLYKNPYHKP